MSGGKTKDPHFKVQLINKNNGHEVEHSHLIYIEHRTMGHSWQYVMKGKDRGPDYPYSTLVAKNGPPSSCPKRRRLRRETEAAERDRGRRDRPRPQR